VYLHDLNEAPIVRFTENGIFTSDGTEHIFDVVLFATGFDLFNSPMRINIEGVGKTYREKWSENRRNYLGIVHVEFPNMLFVQSALTPAIFGNVIVANYEQLDFIIGLLNFMRDNGKQTVTTTVEAEVQWRETVVGFSSTTPFSSPKCNSHYLGSNIPGKPREMLVYMRPAGLYRSKLLEVVSKGYEGFVFS